MYKIRGQLYISKINSEGEMEIRRATEEEEFNYKREIESRIKESNNAKI